MTVLRAFAPALEVASIDEAYIDGALRDAELKSNSARSPARSLLACYMQSRDHYRVLYPQFGA